MIQWLLLRGRGRSILLLLLLLTLFCIGLGREIVLLSSTCYFVALFHYGNTPMQYTSTFHGCELFSIRTHLTYIANAKKLCYIKQQGHSFESARQLTSFTTEQ